MADLLELVYDAATPEGSWTAVLEGLRARLAGTVALHDFDLDGGRGSVNIIVGLPQDAAVAYRDHFSALNPWMHRADRTFLPGEIVVSSEIFPDRTLRRTEFFNDLLAHHDLFRSLGGVIQREQSRVLSVTNVRSERSGDYSAAEREGLKQLLPHLQRAWGLGKRLAEAETSRAAVLHALDRLPIGVLLLDGACRIVNANRAGRRILDARDGLGCHGPELRAATPGLTQRLRDAIAAATTPVSGVPPPLPLRRPSGARAYVALVSALPTSLRGAPGRPVVVLFVSEPDTTPAGDPRLLAELFGLTPAEARLAVAVAAGEDLTAIRVRLGVSANTIKTQLRHVFEKTGTGRQAELVALVLATSLPAEPAS
jgi:DNA-binding CsgD family transcriptional regulator